MNGPEKREGLDVQGLPAIAFLKYPHRPLVLFYMSFLCVPRREDCLRFGPAFRFVLGLC